MPCSGREIQGFESSYNFLAAHSSLRLITQGGDSSGFEFPYPARQESDDGAVLLVLSLFLAARGITGADPFPLLKFAFTGQLTFKTVVKYGDEGEVLEDKMVYILGNPAILEHCMAHHALESHEEEEASEHLLQRGESITRVWCGKE